MHSYCFYEPKRAAFRAKDKDIMQPASINQCLAATNAQTATLKLSRPSAVSCIPMGDQQGGSLKGKPQVQAFGEMSWSRTEVDAARSGLIGRVMVEMR